MAERKGTDRKLLSKVFDYNELVSYQDGSIVSRTIIDNPHSAPDFQKLVIIYWVVFLLLHII
jgi:hypothetical protein